MFQRTGPTGGQTPNTDPGPGAFCRFPLWRPHSRLGLRRFDVFANSRLFLMLALVWQVARAITPEKRG